MEIVPHIGNGLIGQTAGLSGSPDVASPLDKQNAQQPGPLTITEAPANPGDISTAPISDKDLALGDALDQAVSAAFSLPAPPMPEFS